MTGRGEPEQVQSGRVSANFFNVLGVQPVRGRAFSTEEGQAGGANVVVISHAFWLRRFGGNPDARRQ
jgi:hypothetical protein